MFKRKEPYDQELSTTLLQEPPKPVTSFVARATTTRLKSEETPPRIYPAQEAAPYRSPTQAYPRHLEESDEGAREELFRTPSHDPASLGIEEPEAILGETIKVKGELSFENYIRIDGEFEGELLSEGKLHIGPNGRVRSNISLREAIIEGTLEGNITVKERLELRGEARVLGDIEARLLTIDEGVTIEGQVRVKPAAS